MEAARMLPRALQVGFAHAPEELLLLALELVGRAALRALPLVGDRGIDVEEKRGVGLQARMREAFQAHDELARQAASPALVGVGRVPEAAADDPAARRERRLDDARDMLGARGEHEQRFGLRAHRGVQDDLPDALAHFGAAGLARDERLVAAGAHLLADEIEVRRLARPVDALQRDEPAWGQTPIHARALFVSHDGSRHRALTPVFHFPSWYFATARLCSSSERENSWVPS